MRALVAGLVLSVLGAIQAVALAADPPKPKVGVFQAPQLQMQLLRFEQQFQPLAAAGKWADAEALCLAFLQVSPDTAAVHYQLACTQARQGKKDPALASLARAVELGFLNLKHLQEDADLAPLRAEEPYKKIIERAQTAIAKNPGLLGVKLEPAVPVNGVVAVSEKNTGWIPQLGLFAVAVKFPPPEKMPAVTMRAGAAAENLKKWFAEGTAAGNWGDLYDNHDAGHSQMDFGTFPQISRVEFSPEAKAANLHQGLQLRTLYSAVVLGNSSTAMVGTAFWRSQPRAALTLDPAGPNLLALQYEKNHLYFYPEHNDYDAGRNGQGGWGDVYPANTPYMIISQGSSGSDRPFLDAIATLLAAFRPEVKKFLAEKGALMPTVQMIFRMSNKTVGNEADYLSGKAHPAVFDARNLDTNKMVTLAHDIEKERVPPLVRLRMLEEDLGVPGRDYSDGGPREKLFDTPSAIARIFRSRGYTKRMLVTAEDSRDLNGLPLKFHWVVLQGDAAAIKITPKNEQGSRAEIVVPYFSRFPIAAGGSMETNRVDIGVFAHNGTYYSAPAFISVLTLDGEKRVYNEKKLLESLDMADPAVVANYVDPVIATPGRWRDEFHYSEQNQLLGWTRIRGPERQEFTADGALVSKRDELGRPLEAHAVAYVPRADQPGTAPVLEQRVSPSVITYEYASPADRVGKPRASVPK